MEGEREAMISPAEILAEYGVTIVARNVAPRPGQTRAVATVRRIMAKHGEGHMRLVLSTLAETANNRAALDEVGLWAASDLVRACGAIIESRMSEWLELWDAAPVADLLALCRGLSGFASQRYALVGMIYERIYRRFGDGQSDLFDDRRPR